MTDTNFIAQVDKMLKGHYGEDFQWESFQCQNFIGKRKEVSSVIIHMADGGESLIESKPML